MTQTASVPALRPHVVAATDLRRVYVARAVVSLAWVALLVASSRDLRSGDAPSATAAVLLVFYPLWDAAATLLERARDRVALTNVALDAVAAVAMLVAVLSTVGHALLVFGVWASLSGAIMLTVAVRRRRALGWQVPMLISGGLSLFAGASFAASSGTDTTKLTGIAGYSAFGAFWFAVAAVVLTVRSRRTTAA